MYRLIVNTPASGLNFLGVGGVPVINAHRQVRSVLEQKFGDAVANILSEPKRASSNGPIDWYTTCAGNISKLTTAPEDVQAHKRQELVGIISTIKEYADKLPDRQLSTRLKNAVTFPSDEFVYLVGDNLVIVCWGATTEFPDAERQELIKQVNATVTRAPVVAHEAVAPERQEFSPATQQDESISSTTQVQDRIDDINEIRPEPTSETSPKATKRVNFRPFAIIGLLALLLAIGSAFASRLYSSCGIRPLPFITNDYFGSCPDLVLADLTQEAKEFENRLKSLKGKVAEAPRCEETPQFQAKKKQEEQERAREELERQQAAEQERLKQQKAREQAEQLKREKELAEINRKQQEAQAKEMEKRAKELHAKEGEITVRLGWQGFEDLDVIVSCPNGEEISFKTRDACGGKLDIDMNYQGNNSTSPIENIFVPARSIMPGEYHIKVVNNDDAPTSFLLIVKNRGRERRVSGVVNGKSFIQYPLD